MNNFNIIKKIIAKNTGIKLKNLLPNSCSADFVKWDSISNIKIMIAIEKEFKKKISTSKMSELDSIKKIENYLNK
jgi:acyl carrier protein|tara:strand:- start:360 stop:584 length:225 start_codon:yes stop_codon:yes gene_type:complete